MEYFWLVILILMLLGCWSLTLIGLPGNWAMIIVAAVYAYFFPSDARFGFGIGLLVALVAMALLGELFEFAAGALGVTKAGGSVRGAALALAGSIVGGIVGLMVGLPIPVIGPLIAAVFFASLGAMAGSLIGEQWKGRRIEESWQIGKSAFWGRMLGTVGKLVFGIFMVVAVMVAVFV